MIRQFDVVTNPDPLDAESRPYLVNLQHDLISDLRSTVVAPLVVLDGIQGAQRLNPKVTIEGQTFWLATHEMFAIDRRVLKGDPVASLQQDRDAIVAALDLLFTGF
jgi:toxin CcdB